MGTVRHVDRQHLDFAVAMQNGLAAERPDVWSPYSVASALGVASAGAQGRTRDEIVAAISPGADIAETERSLASAAEPREAATAVANTLWTRADVQARDSFVQAVLAWPGGGHEKADFAGDPDGARMMINDDVERTTHGLIRDLLAPGMIHSEIAVVIVNALYLKVAWATPFTEVRTAPAMFHAPSGDRPVPTMRQHESLRFAAADGWRMVSLPAGSDIVVDVLLGEEPTAVLPPAETIIAMHRDARSVKVDLALPRFRVEGDIDLQSPLAHVGVVTAFQPGLADFRGIADAPMHIETAVHKAVLEVDEQGLEGAAATALTVRMTSLDMSRPIEFHVDRPFTVIVRHVRSGAVYFLARVSEP